MTAPVVIMGSGLSGSAVAVELLRHSVPIVVVDAGPGGTRDHFAAHLDTAAMIEPDADPQFKPYRQDSSALHYGRWAGIRFRVGGRSLYWRGIVLRLEPYGLSSWPAELQAALLHGAGNGGLYAEVERQLETWVGAPCDAPRSAEERQFLVRVQSLGFASARPAPRAIRLLPNGCWHAHSQLTQIPPDLIKERHLLTGLALRSDGGVDLQLQGRNGLETCQAAAMVLCAGTVENARIISRMRGTNEVFPIVDHHVQGWLCAVGQRRSHRDSRDASILVAQEYKDRINVFLELHRIGDQDVMDAWSMGEQIPTTQTQLTFDHARNDIRFRVKFTREDEAVLAAQRSFLAVLASAMDLHLEAPEFPISPDRTMGFKEALKRAISVPGVAVPYYCPLGISDHESCALPIGGDIVDINAELRGFPSVFVAGPCLFPRAGAANPSLTTLALSRYLARQVIAKLG